MTYPDDVFPTRDTLILERDLLQGIDGLAEPFGPRSSALSKSALLLVNPCSSSKDRLPKRINSAGTP